MPKNRSVTCTGAIRIKHESLRVQNGGIPTEMIKNFSVPSRRSFVAFQFQIAKAFFRQEGWPKEAFVIILVVMGLIVVNVVDCAGSLTFFWHKI